MNRQKQARSYPVHALHALQQSAERCTGRDQHFCLSESSAYQLLPYVLSKAKVESELGNAASAYSSGFFGGVSDIKDDPKRAAVAARVSRCLQCLGCDVDLRVAEGALYEQRRGTEQRDSP